MKPPRPAQCPKCGYQYRTPADLMGPGHRAVTIDVGPDMTEAQFIEAARRNYRYMIEQVGGPPARRELLGTVRRHARFPRRG